MTNILGPKDFNIPTYPLPQHMSLYVNGAWQAPATDAAELPVIDPSTEETLSAFREATSSDVDRAVVAAHTAFEAGPWPKMSVAARNKVLAQICDVIRANVDELAYLDSLDTGIAYQDVRDRKIGRLANNFEFFAEVVSQASGETYQQNPAYLTFVTHHPVGVSALIAPWNSPLSLASMQLAPCIAFGNTCVLKPSEHTPMALARFVELIHETDIPPGVINLVNGRGAVTGTALSSHPLVRRIKFTGGTETGRAIMSAAATNLTPVSLELGGKSANIICDSANIDAAIDGALLGIFSNNGQQCLAGSRILVQSSIRDAFVDRFIERTQRIKVGNPFDPTTEIGPLAYKAHMERVLSYVDIATQEGGELLSGGRRAAAFERGYFVEPTIVLAPSNEARVAREEIFGPFATLLSFDTMDEAVQIANASDFGLVSYVWTEDLRTALRATRDINAGTVWINTPLYRDLRAPFGGFKHSSIGRDSAQSSMDFFTETKSTLVPYDQLDMAKLGE